MARLCFPRIQVSWLSLPSPSQLWIATLAVHVVWPPVSEMPELLAVLMHRCNIISKTFTFSTNSQSFTQENSYPWIAALIREEVTSNTYVNTKCSSSLVNFKYRIYSLSLNFKLFRTEFLSENGTFLASMILFLADWQHLGSHCSPLCL